MKQHRRVGRLNEAARQATKPLQRTVGHNDQRGRDTISQEAAATVLFLYPKDVTHNEWTTSHLSITPTLSYYWPVSLAVNVVFANDW